MAGASVALTRVRGTIVLTFQGAADATTLEVASEMLMQELGLRHADDVVFEVSGCEVIDFDEFVALRKLVRKVEWLGVGSVIAGIRPGVVAYLVSAGIPTSAFSVALDLEQALFEIGSDDNLNPQ